MQSKKMWKTPRKRNDSWRFPAHQSTCLGSHLHCLPSLLCVRQQLDGDGPTILHGVLQIHKGVAHVVAHAAFPADGHRAGFAKKQEHLGDTERREALGFGSEVDLIEMAAASESGHFKSLRPFEILPNSVKQYNKNDLSKSKFKIYINNIYESFHPFLKQRGFLCILMAFFGLVGGLDRSCWRTVDVRMTHGGTKIAYS